MTKITLGFHKHLLQEATMFLDHEDFDALLKPFENFDITVVS